MDRFKAAWNLRTKSMLVIGLILVAMVAALYFATSRILFSSFAKVEKTTTERNVNRITDAIDDEMLSLSNYTSAYSVWDDTIDFVKRGETKTFNQNATDEYVESNITSATFESERHNLFAFMDTSGKMVWGTGYDLQKKSLRPISKSLAKFFTTGSSLIKYKDVTDYKNGFVIVDEGLMYISIQPLVDSNGEPPIEGTVVTGKDFDASRISAVENKTHLKFSIFKIDASDIPSDVTAAKSHLSASSPIYIHAPNKETVHGYRILKDINGKDILVLRVEVPREVFRQGLNARNYLTISLLVIGVLFLGMALVFLTNLYRRDQEVQELKDRFIAIASHELRTPLTSIRGGVDILSLQKLPPESASSIKLITDGVARLVRLVDELISVVTIERGQFKAKREPVDLAQIVNETCASVQGAATAKGIKLTCQVAPNLPPYNADGRLLRSAVLNLLDNAIKFTDKGGVSAKLEQRGLVIAIEVADTGPGIREEASHMLFKKFAKIASVRESFKEGHGLGLYLTKLAVEAHGGKIEVASSPAGSRFTILLPLK